MRYILIQKLDKKVLGIFSTELIAAKNATKGDYFLIPIETDRYYNDGILSEALSKAIAIESITIRKSEG